MSSASIIASLIPTLIFYCNVAAASSVVSFSPPSIVGSRSILSSIDDGESGNREYAVDLNVTNFNSVLRETTATYAIVEFFAHWCPACRNYKPQYEKVAKIFNGDHPGIILMTRVDCASKANTGLCDKFSVDRYPMLLWGPASKFLSGSWDPKQENSGIRLIDNVRTADLLLNWINKEMGSSYQLDDEKYENNQLQINDSDVEQIASSIHDIEEATATAFDIILDSKMIKPETRLSLVKFFQLLVVHHPSRRCRKGFADILVDFDDFPANNHKKETSSRGEKGRLQNYHICGKGVPRGYWMFCRGSKNDTRGFSCGLWVLLHSLSVRVTNEESQTAFTVICNFIHNYFICQECREHFYSMCSTVSKPFNTAHDFTLWLWKAHNEVNERLMKEEASLGTADPKFLKTIWPPRHLCPQCHLSSSTHVDWNPDEVYRFLVAYYGKSLVSQYNDSNLIVEKHTDDAVAEDSAGSPHAIVIPLGAALAIAIASCVFGAFTYFWHQKQKLRKYKYHPCSLKNV